VFPVTVSSGERNVFSVPREKMAETQTVGLVEISVHMSSAKEVRHDFWYLQG
jgi:hypothetical protein